MPERWLPVAGFDDYEVSDLGRVRSIDRIAQCGNRAGFFLKGRVLKPAANPRGYLHVNLYRDGKAHSTDIHPLVLTTFVGPPPEGMEACHENGDPGDNRLSNLRWDTSAGNKADIPRHGRRPPRTHCPRQHPLVPGNLVPSALPRRSCLACSRAAAHVRNRGLDAPPGSPEFQRIADRQFIDLQLGESA